MHKSACVCGGKGDREVASGTTGAPKTASRLLDASAGCCLGRGDAGKRGSGVGREVERGREPAAPRVGAEDSPGGGWRCRGLLLSRGDAAAGG